MKAKKLLDAVEDGTQSAVEYLTPYVEQALRDSGALADQTYSKIKPVIKDATIRGARLASETFEKVHPAIDEAIDRVSPAVDATVKRVRPAVDDVLDRISPTVDLARDKVQSDILPGLADQLRGLAHQPLARELQVAVASAALADQLDKVSGRRKRGFWRTLGKLVLAGAILGGVVVAVRKLLADPSSGWEAYTPRDNAFVADPVAADEADDVFADDVESEDVASEVAASAPEPAADEADADAPYAGSYLGDEPPTGYAIKANDRSKKYHVPGSASYERTIPELWFASEADAEAAGFVKAQR